MHGNEAITEQYYERLLQLLYKELSGAIASHHVFLAFNRVASKEKKVFQRLHHFATLGNLANLSLQTTFFITAGRIFDESPGSISIHTLLNTTVANPQLVSRAALKRRKRRFAYLQESDPDPDWLADRLQEAWEPTKADLRKLKKALSPYTAKFNKIYKPIRHNYYAHRTVESDQAIAKLFEGAVYAEMTEIMRFAYTLVWEIQETLWGNGREPDLSRFAPYDSYVREVEGLTEVVVRRLPKPPRGNVR